MSEFIRGAHWLSGALVVLVSGGLPACGSSATRTRTRAANSERHAPTYLGGGIDFASSSSPRFELSLGRSPR